jgi:predicted transcriptional regulator
VADIIDLQAERQRVARVKAGMREATTGSLAVDQESPDAVRPPSKDAF